MENYEIREINIGHESSKIAITNLVNEVFNINVNKEKIFLNTYTRNQKTIYLGAYLNDELAALNVFIAHEILYNNENLTCYQSCWSATSIHHRKKGLFSLLINNAKNRLDGAFIFGFPNNNSAPIFLNKLGFRKIDLAKINIPVKFFSNLFLNYYLKPIRANYQFPVEDSFLPIESELIDLKTNEYGDEIKTFGAYNNLIWGKIVKRQSKIGTLSFFCIGGIQVNKPNLLPLLFKEIVKSENIDFIQLIACSNSSLWSLFRVKTLAFKTEPLIIYDLKIDTTNSRFNFITGIKDVF
jgi:hypothetical protein